MPALLSTYATGTDLRWRSVPIVVDRASGRSASPVDIDEVHPRAAATGQGRHHGAERGGGAAAAADHLAEVGRVDPHLEDRPATQLLVAHGDVVRVVDDPANQVLQRLGEHRAQASSVGAASG